MYARSRKNFHEGTIVAYSSSSYCATIWWNLWESKSKEASQMAVIHFQSTWGHQLALYVGSRMVVGWESHPGTQISHRDKRFIWCQFQKDVTAPKVSRLLSSLPHSLQWISTTIPSCSVLPNKSRAVNYTQMWWLIIETAENSSGRACSREDAFTHEFTQRGIWDERDQDSTPIKGSQWIQPERLKRLWSSCVVSFSFARLHKHKL